MARNKYIEEIAQHSVSAPSFPEVTQEKIPVNPDIVKKSTMLLGLKYAIWAVIILITYVTGLARYIGDWAISMGYPIEFYAWFGFTFAFFVLLSAITSYIDYLRDWVYAVQSGQHSMPLVSVIGRWARKTFLKGVLWGSFTYFLVNIYFQTRAITSSSVEGGDTPVMWLVVVCTLGIVLIPVIMHIFDFLSFILSYSVRQVPKSNERERIRQLGKQFRITILDIAAFDLAGDFNVQSRLFGFFGVYFLFVPNKLFGKETLYDSASKALARSKVIQGTVANLVRWAIFAVSCFLIYIAFNWSYFNPIFTWFSSMTRTGDPYLVTLIMLIYGSIMIVGTPIVNSLLKLYDKIADKMVVRVRENPASYPHYLELEEYGKGFAPERDKLTELYLCDIPSTLISKNSIESQ
jgi:hypothetical protein